MSFWSVEVIGSILLWSFILILNYILLKILLNKSKDKKEEKDDGADAK